MRLEMATEARFTDFSNANYVANHMKMPVFFAHAVKRLAEEFTDAVWLEAGSHSTITAMASQALGTSKSSFHAVNVTSDGAFRYLCDTTMKLWKEGQNVSFWPHHSVQTHSYTPVLLPPYQFEKPKHWMELKVPPKLQDSVQVIQQQAIAEAPKGLTTFVCHRDASQRSVRFRVNVESDKFSRLLSGYIMAKTAAVCPGMF